MTETHVQKRHKSLKVKIKHYKPKKIRQKRKKNEETLNESDENKCDTTGRLKHKNTKHKSK